MIDCITNENAMVLVGSRLREYRLKANLSQEDIHQSHGIGTSTQRRLESGKGSTLSVFLLYLDAIGMLHKLDDLLPEPGLSPLQLLKLQKGKRQRASKPRKPHNA